MTFIRYVFFGGLAAIASLCLIVLLVEQGGFGKPAAGAIAIGFSLIVNFASARWIVFKREEKIGIIKQFISFSAVSGLMKALEYGLYLLIITFTPVHYTISYIIALVISNLLKFELYRKHIF